MGDAGGEVETRLEDLPDRLKVGDVAHFLGVRPSTVRKWVRSGRLPAVVEGRTVRVFKPVFEEFLRRGTTQFARDLPEFLTAAEVADILRVHRSTIYYLIRRRDMAAVWVGRSPRVPSSELRRFIEQGGTRASSDHQDNQSLGQGSEGRRVYRVQRRLPDQEYH